MSFIKSLFSCCNSSSLKNIFNSSLRTQKFLVSTAKFVLLFVCEALNFSTEIVDSFPFFGAFCHKNDIIVHPAFAFF